MGYIDDQLYCIGYMGKSSLKTLHTMTELFYNYKSTHKVHRLFHLVRLFISTALILICMCY